MISHRHLHTPTPQIDDGDARLRSTFDVLHQDRHLLDLLGDGVAVTGVAEKSPAVDDQVAFLGGGDAHHDAEFIGVARFALADALDFRCVQGVQPVLVLAPLGGDAPGTFEPRGGHPLQAVGEQRQAVFQVTHERF